MGYMTFEEQKSRHLNFLKNTGLDVSDLLIDSQGFTRARAKGEYGRGEYTYKTASRRLDNGMTGLITWCRSDSGQIKTCKTYGYPLAGSSVTSSSKRLCRSEETCPERIRKFWELSSRHGESDYLKRKRVGAYRIRFRENQYGKVVIVPMIDDQNRLRGYQILNSNGSKVFAKGVQCSGLFHPLTQLTDGLPVGIAEGYATAATCLELTGMTMVAAFTSENLERVVAVLRQHYPNSPQVIFADNDRHLNKNKGVISANIAIKRAKDNGHILVPHFDGNPRTRDYSDWNDLGRTIGSEEALKQILQGLNKALNEKIKQWIAAKSIEL